MLILFINVPSFIVSLCRKKMEKREIVNKKYGTNGTITFKFRL